MSLDRHKAHLLLIWIPELSDSVPDWDSRDYHEANSRAGLYQKEQN